MSITVDGLKLATHRLLLAVLSRFLSPGDDTQPGIIENTVVETSVLLEQLHSSQQNGFEPIIPSLRVAICQVSQPSEAIPSI